jgi:hypothetical protein
MSLASTHRLFQTVRYGIVDADLREELPERWHQQVIAPSFMGSDTARSPVLVEMSKLTPEEQGALLDRLETETRERQDTFFSLLLESDADPKRLADHLAKRLVVELERGGQPMQFRYFDPGTFLQLPGLLGEAGMNWLLGPVKAVLVPWAGEWRRYERSEVAGTGYSLASKLPALLEIGSVNRAAMQMDPPENQSDWVDRCERVRGHVQRARQQHRLSERDDLVAFALHAEGCHPRFDEHKIIRNLLAELAKAGDDDQRDYRELTIGIAPATWEQIARDLTEDDSMEGMPS